MVPCNQFPVFPSNFHTMNGTLQAEIVVMKWNAASEVYALCRQNHISLADWIRVEK